MSEKFQWMDKALGLVPKLNEKLIGAKFVLVAWDTLSDETKLELANAAVEKLKKMGEVSE
jgi:hypothetical protein